MLCGSRDAERRAAQRSAAQRSTARASSTCTTHTPCTHTYHVLVSTTDNPLAALLEEVARTECEGVFEEGEFASLFITSPFYPLSSVCTSPRFIFSR